MTDGFRERAGRRRRKEENERKTDGDVDDEMKLKR